MIAQVQIIQRKSIHAAEQALLKGEAFIKKFMPYIRLFFERADIFLLAICTISSIYGIFMVRRAVFAMEGSVFLSNPTKYVLVQVFSMFLGIGAFALMTVIDADILGEQWRILCLINVGLIIALVIFGADDGTGNKAWIRFAGIGVQPSEVIKILYIIVSAKQMTYLKEYRDINSLFSVAQMAGHFAIVFGMIVVVSSDLGSASILLFFAITSPFGKSITSGVSQQAEMFFATKFLPSVKPEPKAVEAQPIVKEEPKAEPVQVAPKDYVIVLASAISEKRALAYAAKLQALGCKTALDFAKHHKDWVRLTFNNINIVRTWQELNGEDAVPNEELAKKKSICTSRSFNGMISNIDDLKTHVSNYAARCAEKLRKQEFLRTNVQCMIQKFFKKLNYLQKSMDTLSLKLQQK